MNNIIAVFQSYRCPNCDNFFNRTLNLERHSTKCSERLKDIYPKNVYQTQKTLLYKLDSFGIEYTNEQSLFKNIAIFDFESICVQEECFKDTGTLNWIGKHIPISVSISSKLMKEPIFRCNSDPYHLVTSFIGALEKLALQSKAIIKKLFFDIEKTINIKLSSILEKLTQNHIRREQADLDDCVNETCTSTQFLQIQKKQLTDLQEHLARYCNVLPIFSINSAKFDLNLLKSYSLLNPVNERNIEPTAFKKTNQFISFKFGDIQLLDIMNFLGVATSLDSLLKAYKTSETKRFFHYECFDHPDKLQNLALPPYDAFYSKLRSCNPLETEHTIYVNLLKSGLSIEQAVIKLKLSKPPTNGIENYHYLQQIRKQEQMSSFRDFLRWYNNKDVVRTLEAVQKMNAFYHDKDIDMLKLGCTLPNLANFCLHKSTDAKFYPITEADKDPLEQIREDVVAGPAIVFTCKVVVDETFIRASTNICKLENYQCLQQIWKQEQMSSFKDFLRWHNNKDVVPTLEAMQQMIAFYHDKDIDMLKLGCTLLNLANICLHKSTDVKFYPFTEGDKNLLEKIRTDFVGGPSIVFTRKAVVHETFIRKSTNICKSIVGIDASQLYPYSMSQLMPTGLYTRWDLDSETSRSTPRQNKTRSFENMVMSYFQRKRPECEIESFFITGS